MAKKEKRELTPEEKAEKLERKLKKRKLFGDTFFKALAVILTLALIFSVAYIAFSRPVIITQTEYVGGTGNGGSSASSSSSTTPASTTPSSSSSSTTPASTDNNGGSSTPASTDNNGGSDAPADQPQASVAQTINQAMEAAANAGYTWSRTGVLNSLNVPAKSILNGIIGAVSKGSTVESVVGGFLGAKGQTESLDVAKGQTPMNEEGTDTYYHWDQYKIIATSVTDDDLKNVQVNGNNYSFDLEAVVNPEAGNSGFSRFTNDYVTLSMIQQEIAKQVGDKVTVSSMNATYGPMHVDMTIENGKVTALKYSYNASVNPLSLKAGLSINGTGDMSVQASYSNFKY